jgi:hypothetical protein
MGSQATCWPISSGRACVSPTTGPVPETNGAGQQRIRTTCRCRHCRRDADRPPDAGHPRRSRGAGNPASEEVRIGVRGRPPCGPARPCRTGRASAGVGGAAVHPMIDSVPPGARRRWRSAGPPPGPCRRGGPAARSGRGSAAAARCIAAATGAPWPPCPDRRSRRGAARHPPSHGLRRQTATMGRSCMNTRVPRDRAGRRACRSGALRDGRIDRIPTGNE